MPIPSVPITTPLPEGTDPNSFAAYIHHLDGGNHWLWPVAIFGTVMVVYIYGKYMIPELVSWYKKK